MAGRFEGLRNVGDTPVSRNPNSWSTVPENVTAASYVFSLPGAPRLLLEDHVPMNVGTVARDGSSTTEVVGCANVGSPVASRLSSIDKANASEHDDKQSDLDVLHHIVPEQAVPQKIARILPLNAPTAHRWPADLPTTDFSQQAGNAKRKGALTRKHQR